MCVLIRGITHDGKKFRPTNWAERLHDSRRHYTGRKDLLTVIHAGSESQLKLCCETYEACPELHSFIINFAQKNDLVITEI